MAGQVILRDPDYIGTVFSESFEGKTAYKMTFDVQRYLSKRDKDVLAAIERLSRGGKCRICWERVVRVIYGYSVDEIIDSLMRLKRLGKIKTTRRTHPQDRDYTTTYIKLVND